MKILFIATAPKAHCGIAAYAVQQAELLKRQGHTVDWASTDRGTEGVLYPMHGRNRRDLSRLPLIARRYDRVVLHYQHDLFYDGLKAADLIAKNLLLAALFASHRDVEIVVHEMSTDLMDSKKVGLRVATTERLKWRAVSKLVFHTETERSRFLAAMPSAASKCVVREHHAEMVKFREVSQTQARAELSIPAAAPVFLCIGFVQESKGFDRAIRAFAAVKNPDARLYVVGSLRLEHADDRRYIELLRAVAERDSRVQLVEQFVDDAGFDTWISAADVVLLPYRAICSSGVAARARLHGKRMLASNAGGLKDQLGPGDVLFDTEVELGQALATLSGGAKAALLHQHRRADGLKIAFVQPWFGRGVPGGAEALAYSTAVRLAAAGAQVEVLTTTIQDYFHDWSTNARKAGVEELDGVTVRRFPVQRRDRDAFNAANEKVRHGQPVSAEERRIFEDEMIKSPKLLEWIAAHKGDHHLFVFVGYMFSTAVKGSALCPGQAVHVPCLHDEGYLDCDWYARMFREARGVLFNSPAERDLGVRRFGLRPEQIAVPGIGMETDWIGNGERFRTEHGLGDYLLFAGRKDKDKNFPMLVEYFRRYRDERAPELSLCVFGPGERLTDAIDGQSLLDFGFAKESLKRDALAGSLALVQPSLLESFSFTIMESWIAERPVLVHTDGAVTRDHVTRSGGGLWFKSYFEFAACVDRLRADRELARRLGAAGRQYVLSNYSWPTVIDQYLTAFERWRGAPEITLQSA